MIILGAGRYSVNTTSQADSLYESSYSGNYCEQLLITWVWYSLFDIIIKI